MVQHQVEDLEWQKKNSRYGNVITLARGILYGTHLEPEMILITHTRQLANGQLNNKDIVAPGYYATHNKDREPTQGHAKRRAGLLTRACAELSISKFGIPTLVRVKMLNVVMLVLPPMIG